MKKIIVFENVNLSAPDVDDYDDNDDDDDDDDDENREKEIRDCVGDEESDDFHHTWVVSRWTSNCLFKNTS